MSRSRITRAIREANAAVEESNATGAPIDEVVDMRRERKATHVAASQEVVEAYNDAAARLHERGAPEDRVAVALSMDDIQRLRVGAPVDRRGFLKGAGVGAAALATAGLTGCSLLRPARPEAASAPRVAIIGGGLAGLRTAHKLWIGRGIRSTIYEANADIGGRCETERNTWVNNQISEMHGEFVNSEHTAVQNLAASFGLGLDDLYKLTPKGTVDTFWLGGARYTEDQMVGDWKAFGYDAFHSAVLKAPAPQTYASHNAQAVTWDNQDVPTWLQQNLPGGSSTDLYKLALQSFAGEWGPYADGSALTMLWLWAYNASKNTASSYQTKSYLNYEGVDARWHIKGGNDQLVTQMAAQLPAGTVIAGTAVAAVAKNADGSYRLTLKAGTTTSTVTVDHVVFACTFTSLRTNVDLSKAGLSALKMTAINTASLTVGGKVMAQFNGHPWYQYNYDYVLGDSPYDWWWDANYQTNQLKAPTSIMTHYVMDGTTRDLISRYGLTAHEAAPPAALMNEILPPLDTLLGPGCSSAFNGKAWYHFGLNDPWVLGAWPYYKVGQVTGFSGYEGVRERNLHFASDQTDWDFIGDMEGAVRSGERCAAEI